MNDTPSTGSPEPWRVRLLGTFQVERNGKAAAFRTKKTASLLAYLVYYRGRRVSKDLLIDALWPEADSEKGRHSLRVALSSLRQTFETPDWNPAEHIWSDRDSIELSESGFVTDVKDFHSYLKQAKTADSDQLAWLGKALDLYQGTFLPSFGDEWILPQALEIEETYAQAAAEFVVLAAQQNHLAEAVARGRRAISLCANREDLHVAMMRAYAHAGQSGQALKQYEELERMLDDVWGEMPGEEAQAILDALPRRAVVAEREEKPVIAYARVVDAEAPRSSFFGRDRELQELREMLTDGGVRVVTLFGLGGSGKTRLAQRCAQLLRDEFTERIWFVSLVGIEEASQLHEAILSAIDSTPVAGSDVLGSAAERIGASPALLVLDNAEQVVPAARAAIDHLRNACAGLRILSTSRIPIDAEGERLVPVTPLDLPDDFRDLVLLRNAPSVQLLVDAAQSVRPGFAVTPANAQSVHILCQRLEGIPLAIELAAAKLGTLTPAQVIASIGRRVDLSSTKEQFREQHRSLRTVIEWSLGLLTDGERASFSRLGVCRGGFNHRLAAILLGKEAEDHIQRLCRYALVGWTETTDEVRFEMLETVREIAQALLEGEDTLFDRATFDHFEYARDLCTSLEREENVQGWVAKMQADIGNIFAALESATSGMIPASLAWELALPLEFYVDRTGRAQIWIAPLDNLLLATRDDLDPVGLARAHALLAFVHYGQRDIRTTYDHYVQAIAAADQTQDTLLRIDLRTESISSTITLGAFDEAQKSLEEAIELLQGTDDFKAAASCYLNLAWVLFDRGMEEESEPVFRQALEHAERSADPVTIASALTGWACGVGQTRYQDAQPIFDRAVETWRGTGLPARLAHSWYYRGLVDYRHGKLESAVTNIERSFRLFSECGIALGQSSLTICGNTLAAMNRPADAAMSWGRAEAARRKHSMRPIPSLQKDFEKEVAKVRSAMSNLEYERAFERSADLADRTFVDLLFGSA